MEYLKHLFGVQMKKSKNKKEKTKKKIKHSLKYSTSFSKKKKKKSLKKAIISILPIAPPEPFQENERVYYNGSDFLQNGEKCLLISKVEKYDNLWHIKFDDGEMTICNENLLTRKKKKTSSVYRFSIWSKPRKMNKEKRDKLSHFLKELLNDAEVQAV